MIFNKEIYVGNKIISSKTPTFVIAEAGVNHGGDISLAKEMIDAAKEAGADAVKFQSFKTEELILKNIAKAPYQKKTTDENESQFDMLKKLEITKDNISELKEYCEKKGIVFLSTPFEKASLDELDELGVDAYKVAATDITNIQFVEQVAKKNKPIFLSAGMCYMEEVKRTLDAVGAINKNIVLMQCTANYPFEDNEANIKVVETFKNSFDILVGYSDHSKGIGASPFAVALGAKVIEKHFTLDKNMKGPDHKASIEPDELKQLISDIRRVEKYLGDGQKMPTLSEQKTRKSLQKCFVAKKVIKKGEIFTSDNIVAKRTDGVGIPATYYHDMLGKEAEKDYEKDDII